MPRMSTRGSRSRKIRILKICSLLVAVPAIAIAIFLVHYYYIFNGIIEEKFGKRYNLSQIEIYAAPVVLYPGERVQLAELLQRVRRLGYNEIAGTAGPNTSGYQVIKSNQVAIYNDSTVPEDANRQALVMLDGRVIRSIVDLKNRTELTRLALKPEMLSTAINKNREKRRYVAYRDLPGVLVNAVLASEDRRFFSHRGVDPIRIIKALIVDVREGDIAQGASTLTQQFVKNYFLTQERTWRRKFADAYLSVLLEKRLSKEEIFELYANEVYLGQIGSFSIVGFGEASDAFFDKSVKDLTLEEAALLTGIISAPNRYTPLRYPERAKVRRNLVLDRMAEYEMITARERDEAEAKPIVVKPTSILNYSDAPYFVDYVQDILVEKFGDAALARAKFHVYTTLETDLQQAAFEAVRTGIQELDGYFAKGKRAISPGTVQASLIAVDPRNGQILAMVGGRNYATSQYNRIIQSKRQPGSIFKPFVYAAALETAYYSSTPLTVVSTVLDEPTQFAFENLVYEPRNFKDEYFGQVTMRQAITKSLNIATIKLAEKVGFVKITELANRLGLNEQIKPYPAMAIGAFEVSPLEMVRAYTAFANGGLLSDLTPVLRISDDKGRPVYLAKPHTEQVLTPQVAFMITSLLQSVMNNGTGAGVRTRGFNLPAAGKTGTSRDGWFAGYTPDFLCIVWVGFDDNRELNLSGSQSALPIWAEFMKKVQTLRPLTGEGFPVPEGITEVEIDPSTGLLATQRCLERQMEYFINGTEPKIRCYGNSYEQLMSGGGPASIYATPSKEPANGTDNKNGAPEEKKKPAGQ
jgi:penicillin-binding protein 1B